MDIGTVAAGIVVVGVSERGPAAGILAPGDTITKVGLCPRLMMIYCYYITAFVTHLPYMSNDHCIEY